MRSRNMPAVAVGLAAARARASRVPPDARREPRLAPRRALRPGARARRRRGHDARSWRGLYAVLANGGRAAAAALRCATTRRRRRSAAALLTRRRFVTLDMLRSNPRPDAGLRNSARGRWPWPGRPAPRGASATPGRAACSAPTCWSSGSATSTARQPGLRRRAGGGAAVLPDGRCAAQPGPRGAIRRQAPACGTARVEVCARPGTCPTPGAPSASRRGSSRASRPSASRRAPARAHGRAHGRGGLRGIRDHEMGGARILAPDMLRLFREAGLPRRDPPRLPDCASRSEPDEAPAPTILSPQRGVSYAMRLSRPAALALNANSAPGKQYWFAGNAFIGEAAPGQALAWLPPGAGRYHCAWSTKRDGRTRARCGSRSRLEGSCGHRSTRVPVACESEQGIRLRARAAG